MKLSCLYVAWMALATAVLTSSMAQAQSNYHSVTKGTTTFGTVYRLGGFQAQPPPGGWLISITTNESSTNCSLAKVRIFRTLAQGDITLDAEGTWGPVTIGVVTAPTRVCAYDIHPPALGDRWVSIRGSDFDDTLINTGISHVQFHGNGGNDTIWNTNSRAREHTYGEEGSDLFLLGSGEFATGEEDGDLFCVFPGVVAGRINGDGGDSLGEEPEDGGGTDVLCGRASFSINVEVNEPNCSCF